MELCVDAGQVMGSPGNPRHYWPKQHVYNPLIPGSLPSQAYVPTYPDVLSFIQVSTQSCSQPMGWHALAFSHQRGHRTHT
jgi:hypothetical protein